MRIRRSLIGLAAAGLAVGMVLSGCASGGDDDNGDSGDTATPSFEDCEDNPVDCNSGPRAEGGEITWLINQGWDSTWNRMTSVGNTSYLNQALSGVLLDIGEWQPDGEYGWNMDLFETEPQLVSEDPMVIEYPISEDAVWSDGTPIGVNDFTYAWYVWSGNEDYCEGCTPPATTFYDSIESIEAEGQTLTMTMQEGFQDAEWFARLEDMYPWHVAEAAGFDLNDPASVGESMQFWIDNVPEVSGGPYLVEDAVVDERVVLVPNPQWYGEVQPTFERITKVVISEQGSWMPAIEGDELDGGWPASWTTDFAEQIAGVPGMMSITGSAGSIWEHVDVNMDSLDDLALRRAIFTAINIGHASDAIWGDINPPRRTNHIFPEASPNHEDLLTATGYGTGEADAARAILEDAGYTGFEEGGTLTDPDGEAVPPLRFAYLDGNQNRATFVELTIAYLAQIGLTVEPEPTPGEQLGTVLEAQDFDLVIFGWVGNPQFTGTAHQFYHSTSDSNYGNIQNDQLDQLTEQVRNQIDVAAAADLANQADQIVMDEAFSLPLWDNPGLVFAEDRYFNIRPNWHAQPNVFYNIGEWGLAEGAAEAN